MKPKILAAAIVLFFILASQLGAFDNQRKGFVLGAGGGVGFLAGGNYPSTYSSKVSAAANFKIGYAPSNSLEISYLMAASGPYDIYDEGHYIFGVNALALTYYFNPGGKGWYFTAGAGAAFQSESGYSQSGVGVIAGIGYELGKHWSIQGDVLYTNADGDKYAMLRLTINILGF